MITQDHPQCTHSTIGLAKLSILHQWRQNAQVPIMRTFKGCIGVRVRGKRGLEFRWEELNSQVQSNNNHLFTKDTIITNSPQFKHEERSLKQLHFFLNGLPLAKHPFFLLYFFLLFVFVLYVCLFF